MFERLENELEITERHLRVLDAVAEYEQVGLITLTNRLSYPKHKIRYSLRVLEAKDLIQSTACGVSTTNQATKFRKNADQRVDSIAQAVESLRLEDQFASKTESESVVVD